MGIIIINLIRIMKKILFILILFIGFSVFSQKSKYDTYRVSKGETITSIARKLGITPYDLIKLNPDATNGINIDEVLIVPSKNTPINKISTNTKTTTKPQISNIKINKGLVKAKDSIVDGFLYHTVKPLETVYSLSSKYNVSKRKVRRLNKLNKNGDISVGQVLKFPTSLKNSYTKKKEKTIVKDSSNDNLTNNYFIYLVKQKDTYYTLTKIYDVTEEKLKEINPVLNDGLKAGLEIRIPKPVKKTIVSVEKGTTDSVNLIEQPKYKIHVIEEQEGFFRLKELFGVTKEELIKVNPELVNGLLLGMEIKIPIKNEQSLFMEGDIHGKILNVVMLLPFKADSNISFSDDSKNAKRLNGVTDFYLGSLMALDSIKKKGL
ncbi:MAG TPA: LysM peptidoglycan-binding domain-containing protein, partial [Flavobacteriaceae bacterium]|nr:LysM peptidoglycan-binding domain-containing protein [Flavobacteriaceae bacterium]